MELHYLEYECEFVLFTSLSVSLQDSLVNSDDGLTVNLTQVMKKTDLDAGLFGGLRLRVVSGGKFFVFVCFFTVLLVHTTLLYLKSVLEF